MKAFSAYLFHANLSPTPITRKRMFSPSARQSSAIENMERAAGIGNGRTHFDSHDDFDQYFKSLSAKIEKRKSVGEYKKRVGRDELARKKAEYFTRRPERLFERCVEYLGKYLVSTAKMRKYVVSKVGECELTDKTMERLSKMMNDQLAAETMAHGYLLSGKSVRVIAQKLALKMFDKQTIKDAIEAVMEEAGSYPEKRLDEKVKKLMKKGLSKSGAKFSMKEYGRDGEAAVERVYGSEGSSDALETLVEKLSKSGKSGASIIRKIIASGHSWDAAQKMARKYNINIDD